jgi:hypothetical protein
MMHLNLVNTLLEAADEQPYGFLKVRGADLGREVELMAAAGLVDASLGNADPEAFAVINRVTDSGHAFLRAFKNHRPPRMAAFASAEH